MNIFQTKKTSKNRIQKWINGNICIEIQKLIPRKLDAQQHHHQQQTTSSSSTTTTTIATIEHKSPIACCTIATTAHTENTNEKKKKKKIEIDVIFPFSVIYTCISICVYNEYFHKNILQQYKEIYSEGFRVTQTKMSI